MVNKNYKDREDASLKDSKHYFGGDNTLGFDYIQEDHLYHSLPEFRRYFNHRTANMINDEGFKILASLAKECYIQNYENSKSFGKRHDMSDMFLSSAAITINNMGKRMMERKMTEDEYSALIKGDSRAHSALKLYSRVAKSLAFGGGKIE
jgi:hypothetical protein